MQFLVITRRYTETFSDADFAAVLPEEAVQARKLYAEGSVRGINSRGDIPGAILHVEAADAADAARIVGSLPLAQKRMMAVEIIPVLPYRGFVGG